MPAFTACSCRNLPRTPFAVDPRVAGYPSQMEEIKGPVAEYAGLYRDLPAVVAKLNSNIELFQVLEESKMVCGSNHFQNQEGSGAKA